MIDNQPSDMSNSPITLYVLSTCPQCKALRQLLIDHGITFDTIDVDLLPGEERSAFMEAMRPHNPKMAFPVTIVGGKAIIGFQKELLLQELGVTG